MFEKLCILRSKPWFLAYDDGDGSATGTATADGSGDGAVDGSGDGAADANANGADQKKKTDASNNGHDEPKFTQSQVNKIMAEERRKQEVQSKKQIAQLEELKKTSGLTQKQRDELQARIEELNTSMLTKEEQAKRDKERLSKEYTEKLKSTESERDEWKLRYTRERIAREISDAAKSNDGYNDQQFVRHLAADTVLAEVLDDDGKATGNYITQVAFSDTDKDGKPITLKLSVTEAVKRMKELPEFHNFFKSTTTGGIGGSRNTGSGRKEKSIKDMTPEEYRKHREEQRAKKK